MPYAVAKFYLSVSRGNPDWIKSILKSNKDGKHDYQFHARNKISKQLEFLEEYKGTLGRPP